MQSLTATDSFREFSEILRPLTAVNSEISIGNRYGRWKKTTNVFDHSALFPETRQIMQELGYDIAPAALEVDTSTTN